MKQLPNNQPLVSVLVPSYQAGRYLGLLIDSVMTQTHQDWELLILDDGSGDLDHPEVARRLEDPRIRTFRWQPNRGVSLATRFLMEEARGDYWCYPGADDLLRTQFMEKRLAVMAAHPEVSFIFGRGGQIDADGKETWFPLAQETFERLQPRQDRVISGEEMLRLLLAGNIINTPSILARTRATLPTLTRYSMDWRYCQDWFYWLLLAANGLNFYYDSELLHDYRFHAQAMTQSQATWAWRNVEPALVLLTGMSLAAQTGELGLQYFRRHRIELFGNWLVRSAKFRGHESWGKWSSLAGLASISPIEWPQAAWSALRVLQLRRRVRRQGRVMHGLPSAYCANLLFK